MNRSNSATPKQHKRQKRSWTQPRRLVQTPSASILSVQLPTARTQDQSRPRTSISNNHELPQSRETPFSLSTNFVEPIIMEQVPTTDKQRLRPLKKQVGKFSSANKEFREQIDELKSANVQIMKLLRGDHVWEHEELVGFLMDHLKADNHQDLIYKVKRWDELLQKEEEMKWKTVDAETQTLETMKDIDDYKPLYFNLANDLNQIYQDNCVAFRFECQGNAMRELATDAVAQTSHEILDAVKVMLHSTSANKLSIYTQQVMYAANKLQFLLKEEGVSQASRFQPQTIYEDTHQYLTDLKSQNLRLKRNGKLQSEEISLYKTKWETNGVEVRNLRQVVLNLKNELTVFKAKNGIMIRK